MRKWSYCELVPLDANWCPVSPEIPGVLGETVPTSFPSRWTCAEVSVADILIVCHALCGADPAGAIFVHAFGEFPVPLLGFGASPLVGAFLALATLERVRSAADGGAAGEDAAVDRHAKRARGCGKATPT